MTALNDSATTGPVLFRSPPNAPTSVSSSRATMTTTTHRYASSSPQLNHVAKNVPESTVQASLTARFSTSW